MGTVTPSLTGRMSAARSTKPQAAVEPKPTTRRSAGRPSCGMVLSFSTRVVWHSKDGDSRGAGLFPPIQFLLFIDSLWLARTLVLPASRHSWLKMVEVDC